MGMCFKWVYTKALHLVWDILHINSRRKYLENLFECARFLSLLWNIRNLGSPGYLNWKLRDKLKRQMIRLKFEPGHRCHQVWGCSDQGQNPCEILMVARNHPASKITSTEGIPDLLQCMFFQRPIKVFISSLSLNVLSYNPQFSSLSKTIQDHHKEEDEWILYLIFVFETYINILGWFLTNRIFCYLRLILVWLGCWNAYKEG